MLSRADGSDADPLEQTHEDPELAQDTPRTRLFWLLNNTLNRVTRRIARSRHGPFSPVRHVGRKSGRTYETPVILAQLHLVHAIFHTAWPVSRPAERLSSGF